MIAPRSVAAERRGREAGEDRGADVDAGVEDDAGGRPAASGSTIAIVRKPTMPAACPAVDHGRRDDRHDGERRCPAPTLTPSIGSGNASAASRGREQTGDACDLGPGRRSRHERHDRGDDPDDAQRRRPGSRSAATGRSPPSARAATTANGGSFRHCLQRLFCGRLFAIPWELKLHRTSFRRPLPGTATPLGSRRV